MKQPVARAQRGAATLGFCTEAEQKLKEMEMNFSILAGHRKLNQTVGLLFALALCASPLWAQVDTGPFWGAGKGCERRRHSERESDPYRRGHNPRSNQGGGRRRNLPVHAPQDRIYAVSVEVAGFQKAVQSHVTVDIQQHVTVDITEARPSRNSWR